MKNPRCNFLQRLNILPARAVRETPPFPSGVKQAVRKRQAVYTLYTRQKGRRINPRRVSLAIWPVRQVRKSVSKSAPD